MASIFLAAAMATVIAAPVAPVDVLRDGGGPVFLVQQGGPDPRFGGPGEPPPPPGGGRPDCRAAAGRALGQTGGELLSVMPAGNSCIVTVLVPGRGDQRPRKMTIRVPAR